MLQPAAGHAEQRRRPHDRACSTSTSALAAAAQLDAQGHFRCMPEIIDFQQILGGELQPLPGGTAPTGCRRSSRTTSAAPSRAPAPGAVKHGPEAEALVDAVVASTSPAYASHSMSMIAMLGTAQAALDGGAARPTAAVWRPRGTRPPGRQRRGLPGTSRRSSSSTWWCCRRPPTATRRVELIEGAQQRLDTSPPAGPRTRSRCSAASTPATSVAPRPGRCWSTWPSRRPSTTRT